LSVKSLVDEFYQFSLESDDLETCPRCGSSEIGVSLWNNKESSNPSCGIFCRSCVDIYRNDVIGIDVTVEGVGDLFSDGCKWAIWETRRACNFTGVAAWNAYAKYLKVEKRGIRV
jgi:hypothetical protein